MAYTCPSIDGWYVVYYDSSTDSHKYVGETLPTIGDVDKLYLYSSATHASSGDSPEIMFEYIAGFNSWIFQYRIPNNPEYRKSVLDFTSLKSLKTINGKPLLWDYNGSFVTSPAIQIGRSELDNPTLTEIVNLPRTVLNKSGIDVVIQNFSNLQRIGELPTETNDVWLRELPSLQYIPPIGAKVGSFALGSSGFSGVIEFLGNTAPRAGSNGGLKNTEQPIKIIHPNETNANAFINSAVNHNVSKYIPCVTRLLSQRCDSNGVENDEGTYVKLTLSITGDPIDTIYTANIKVDGVQVATQSNITVSSTNVENIVLQYNGFSDVPGVGVFGTDSTYNIEVELTENWGRTTAVSNDTLTSAFFTIDIQKGGKEIAFGTSANDDNLPSNGEFKCAMDTMLLGGLSYKGLYLEAREEIWVNSWPIASMGAVTISENSPQTGRWVTELSLDYFDEIEVYYAHAANDSTESDKNIYYTRGLVTKDIKMPIQQFAGTTNGGRTMTVSGNGFTLTTGHWGSNSSSLYAIPVKIIGIKHTYYKGRNVYIEYGNTQLTAWRAMLKYSYVETDTKVILDYELCLNHVNNQTSTGAYEATLTVDGTTVDTRSIPSQSRSNIIYLIKTGQVSIDKNSSGEFTLVYTLKGTSSNVYTSTVTTTIQYNV